MTNSGRRLERPHLSSILASLFYAFDKHSGPRVSTTRASEIGGLFSHIKEPVRRAGAETYLLITLLAFAASVVFTRILLDLSGYPQVGEGSLHIAHVLWGGLLLFVASLLPLIFANRWVFSAGALLSGVGVGLFIDEVGKFITQTNDYFYPPAAPIIYAFFLLTVIVYLRVRRQPRHEPRAELYRDLDVLTEVLDHDLEPDERADLEVRLRRVAREARQPELARLATDLVAFLTSDALRLEPEAPTLWERLVVRARALEARYLGRKRLKALLIGGFCLLGVPPLAALAPLLGVAAAPAEIQREFLIVLAATRDVTTARELNLLVLRVALTALAGLPLLLATGYLVAGHDRRGIEVGHFGLLLYLSAVNLLVFYFDQFQAVGGATIQFALLLGTIHYRLRYLAHAENRL